MEVIQVRQVALTIGPAMWEAMIVPAWRGSSLRRADDCLDQGLWAILEEDWRDGLVPWTARVH